MFITYAKKLDKLSHEQQKSTAPSPAPPRYLTLSSSALIICPYTGRGQKKRSYLLIELCPMVSFASSETRIEISTCNFTNQTFLVNPNSSRQTRYSLQKICRFRSQFSSYFAVMEDWINFEFSIPDFGGILRGNSSSDGVNNQVNYLYILKTSSNSSSFVTYPLSKSTSENRQNVPKNQASSGQSGGSDRERQV